MYFTLGPCIPLLLLSMLLCYCRVLHVSPLDYASWTLRYIYLCYYCVCYCVIVEFYIFHPWTMPAGPSDNIYLCLCYCVIVELYIFHPWIMPPGPLDIYLLLLSMLLCYCRVLHIPPLDHASWTLPASTPSLQIWLPPSSCGEVLEA